MHQRAFDSSYTGFTADGAKYLAENTNVKTIGIDYLSIATYEENSKAHVHLLVVPLTGHIPVIHGQSLPIPHTLSYLSPSSKSGIIMHIDFLMLSGRFTKSTLLIDGSN
jgi:hypothetical protein